MIKSQFPDKYNIPSSYTAVVESMAEMALAHQGKELTYYHRFGAMIHSVMGEGDYHREGIISQLAKDLEARGISGCKVSSLYKARNFFLLITSADLEKLIRDKWRWRNVSRVACPTVSEAMRNEIIRSVHLGEMKQDDAIDYITDAGAPRGSRKLVKAARTILRDSKDCAASITDMMQALKRTPIRDASQQELAATTIEAAIEQLKSALAALRSTSELLTV
jgi:hypothetical protein